MSRVESSTSVKSLSLYNQGHSVGVGTPVYCSPEQAKSNWYDAKTDMYSLGIIIFELFFKMKTNQEKYINIKKLKEGSFPSNFESRCG